MAKQLANVLAKIFLVSIPFILASLCMALLPYWTFDHEYPIFQQRKDYIFQKSHTAYDVIILGDSGIQAAIKPLQIDAAGGVSTYNLALPGNTSIQTYFMLKHYLESGKSAKTAFISFVPLHFWQVSDFWNRSAYFHLLPTRDMLEVGYNAWKLNARAFDDYLPKLISYQLYFVNRYSSALKRLGRKRMRSNKERYAKLAQDRGHHMFGTEAKIEEHGIFTTYKQMPTPDPVVDLYFDRLIKLCLDNKMDVIIEQAPLNDYDKPLVEQSFLASYRQFLQKYKDRYPAITLNAAPPFYPSNCFGDPLHVNAEGSERYTRMIMEKYPNIFFKK